MTIADKIQAWCDDSLTRLVQEYDAQGRRASGQWEKDLESKVERTIKGYKVSILGSHYSYFMEKGRKPNKNQEWGYVRKVAGWMANSQDGPIYEWCQHKNISVDYAFPIAVKIIQEGYEGRPLASKIITSEWAGQLIKNIGFFYVEQLKSDVINEFRKVS